MTTGPLLTRKIPWPQAIRLQPPSTFTSATEYLPSRLSLPALRKAAAACQACDLWRTGTQTVFGEGARGATIIFVGEQPGNDEDNAGRPFVGPSGRLLDAALDNAGIDRSTTYVTNIVKHFKWERRGVLRSTPGKITDQDKRIHKTPSSNEIRACRPWFEAELRVVQPRVIVCLGATAAQAILGRGFRVTHSRGRPVPPPDALVEMMGASAPPTLFATVHPSSVLRARTSVDRDRARKAFFSDIERVAKYL